MFQYFTVTCYRGYDNTAGAFYAVYRDVFERLAAEDLEFMDSDDEDTDIPGFGDANSDYEQVVGPFYAYWLSYCTKKTYTWLCPHNLTEIRDRRILRHVEKDTKKLAQKARKERNDEVRALVAFVKKRDRRVLEYRRVLEERAEQNRMKQQEKRLEQIRRNRAEVEAEMLRQKETGVGVFGGDYEAQLRQMEAAYGRDSDDDDDEDEDEEDVNEIGERLENGVALDGDDEPEYIDHLFCVACNKSFKNESSMQNHQSSKKHKENIEKLRVEMLDEEDEFNAGKSEASASESPEEVDDTADIAIDSSGIVNNASDSDHVSEESQIPVRQSKKARRKMQKVIASMQSSDEDDTETVVAPAMSTETKAENDKSDIDDDDQPKKATKKSKRRAKHATADVPTKSNLTKPPKKAQVSSAESDDDIVDIGQRKGGRKANAKAARKAAAAKKPVDLDDEDVDIDHTCVTCGGVFDSKNKLFNHLKQMNHGVYIEGKGAASRASTAASAAAASTTASASAKSRTKGRKK